MYLSLNNIFKPEFRTNCLLISGSEDCAPLINYVNELCLLRAGENCQRKTFQADRYFNIQIIIELLNETSLFGDRNFIILSFKTKPTVEQQKQLTTVISNLDENNILIINCDKLDKKEQSANWVSQFNQMHDIILLDGNNTESRIWGIHLFANQNLEIESPALDLLISLNQNNLSQLYQEITKLSLIYQAPHLITLTEAQENLLDNAQFNIFALSNAYLLGNVTQTKKIFMNICNSTEDSILVLWSIGEDLRKLIKIKAALKSTPDINSAISNLRIWGDAVNAFKAANKRISYQKAIFYFNQLAEIDQCIKGIKAGNALDQIEQLIINFSQGV